MQQPTQPSTAPAGNRPNEQGTVSVQGFVRIFDPNSKKTIMEKRS